MLTPTRLFWISLAFGFGCAPADDPRPAAQRSTTRLGAAASDAGLCVDEDGDTYGAGCYAGEDCDDTDPAITDQCRRCVIELPDCPCAAGANPVACDVDTDGPVTPKTCFTGQRNCEDGRWGRCVSYRDRFN
jgi:hypothetical protein